MRKPASFWRENVITGVILLQVLGQSNGKKLSNVRSIIILLSGECLTSINKNNRVNFWVKSRPRILRSLVAIPEDPGVGIRDRIDRFEVAL